MGTQELFFVFGGTLVDTQSNDIADINSIDIVGIFGSYDEALAAWRGRSQTHVDEAFTRYFIAPVHELLSPDADEEAKD